MRQPLTTVHRFQNAPTRPRSITKPQLLGRYGLVLLLALMTQAGCSQGGPDAGKKDTGASSTNQNLPLEPLPDDPLAELSNLRFGPGSVRKEKYSVDWRWTKKGAREMDMTLIVKPRDSMALTVNVNAAGKKSGTVSGEYISSLPGGKDVLLSSGCEMYLVLDRGPKYKISNSVTSGDVPITPTRPGPP